VEEEEMSFLTDEQKALALEIASLLAPRNQTVAVAESTCGGLISAALLWCRALRSITRAGA
jgi:nicotinamide mononucleotide (NMN) deamidase PncC